MLTNKPLEKYLQALQDTDKKGRAKSYTVKSALKNYLKWRGLETVSELIASGLTEESFFKEYIENDSILPSTLTKKVRVSLIKQFLRFAGVAFKRFDKTTSKITYYKEDRFMEDFLELDVGESKSSQKAANRALNNYCQFRNMSPTELVEEVKEERITVEDLRDSLVRHFKQLSLEVKTAKKQIPYLLTFYYFRAGITIRLQSKVKKKDKGIIPIMLGGKTVAKQEMKQLLTVADLRDSMIIMMLFENGSSGIDLCNLTFGELKDYLNLDNPEAIEYGSVAVIIDVRQKTNYQYLSCFGTQSLKLISKWLKVRRDGILGVKETITDESFIISTKRYPYQKISRGAITQAIKRLGLVAGFTEPFTPADFRNSFNTRTKKILKHFDKELFMGHSGSLERHYDNSEIEYYTNEYRKAWEILFDLSYDHERIVTVEEENREIKAALRDVSKVLESLFNVYSDPAGQTNLTKEDLDKAIDRLRNLGK